MPYTTSCNTQSIAPEDGQNNCPKHVELIGIINKLLLLRLLGCLYYCVIIIIIFTVGLRVPNQNLRVLVCLKLPLKLRKNPSAREASAANAISRISEEFNERSVLLEDF